MVATLGLAWLAAGASPALAVSSPSPNPPGSANSSPDDYNGAIWVVVAAVVVAAIVAAGTFYLVRTRRIDLGQVSKPDDEEQHQS
ncbi:hypothetical protein AB0E69_20115 [Kribbella sp. NPDC026611]|uniref:hypothetical protein n=1 Tax=Kribbella sp. NPDC026611 TaxID=3154911 RepID=UPI003407C6DB